MIGFHSAVLGLSIAGAITVHSVVAPSGELRGKGRCGV